ncbi:hypothetical protein, partial [Streptomyces cyaneofuscatus]|uniref:hypothetical protein n=1 Tax=Streptomyces cyaneofuscatus TaxID=66883 RepID=UPI002FF26BE8
AGVSKGASPLGTGYFGKTRSVFANISIVPELSHTAYSILSSRKKIKARQPFENTKATYRQHLGNKKKTFDAKIC